MEAGLENDETKENYLLVSKEANFQREKLSIRVRIEKNTDGRLIYVPVSLQSKHSHLDLRAN